MRGWWWLLFVTACGSEERAVHLDVVVREEGVAVYAHDPDLDRCGNPFPDVGDCSAFTDADDCPPASDTAIGGYRIERGGEILADTPIDDRAFLQVADIAGQDGFELVVVGDGVEERLPMPAVEAPVPQITEVTATSSRVDVAWTAAPTAETALVDVSTGFVSRFCHVSSTEQPASVDWPGGPDFLAVSVQAFAPAALAETTRGEVRFWYGATVTQSGP